MPSEFQKDPFKTVGNHDLCAWAVDEAVTMIQTRRVNIAKKLAKESDAHLVAGAVKGSFLRIYSMPYTLSWVSRNVVSPLLEGVNP